MFNIGGSLPFFKNPEALVSQYLELQSLRKVGGKAPLNLIPVVQGIWGKVSGTDERLNLRKLSGQLSDDGKQLYGVSSDEPIYQFESNNTGEGLIVKPYTASKNPLMDEYQGWTPSQTTSLAIDTPFGPASARHSRGAPFAQTNATDYSNEPVGDSYRAMVSGLRGNTNDASNDPELAAALLNQTDVNLNDDVQKNAAAKLTVTVNMAEEWRKQGAAKIFRALMRLVEAGEIEMSEATNLFAFVQSADAGRKQVARFQDVFEGDTNQSDLDEDEQMIYGAFSPIREDDLSSDDELRVKKKLKKRRLYSKKHEDDSD